MVRCTGIALSGLGERPLEPLGQHFLLVKHPPPLLGISLLLGQNLTSQIAHSCVGVLEEPVELPPAPAGDVQTTVKEAVDIALALPVLPFLMGQARALAAKVATMVASGEALVRPPAPAAPAEMTAPLAEHTILRARPPR